MRRVGDGVSDRSKDEDNTTETFDHELKADKNCAQILIEISDLSRPLEEAKKIIETNGVRIIETTYLSPSEVLIKIDAAEMREIVLYLIESGFSIIKGINAAAF
jgi:hypothetical protein